MTLLALLASQRFLVEPLAAQAWLDALPQAGSFAADAKAFFDGPGEYAPVRYRRRGGEAVIQATGMMMPRDSWLSAMFGASSYEGIMLAVEQADQDPQIDTIVVEVDSFGGSTAKLMDAVGAIMGSTKKTIARVTGNACSAALFLALAADETEAHSLAMVGSMGAIFEIHGGPSAHEGGRGPVKFVSSVSPNKGADPTSAAGAAIYQQVADDLGHEYIAFVAARTGLAAETLPQLFHDGGIVTARRAVEAGLINRLIEPRLAEAPNAPSEENPMDPEERIAELEAENEKLRQRNAELEAADDAETEDGEAMDDDKEAEAATDEAGATAAEERLAEATARLERQTAKMGATVIFRAGLAAGRVKPAEKEACVGRLTEALMGLDEAPDDWAGALAFCKASASPAAREWLSVFGTREPNEAVDLGVRTEAQGAGAEPGFDEVRAALCGDGISADLAARLSISGALPKGGMSVGAADDWIIKNCPRLYPLG